MFDEWEWLLIWWLLNLCWKRGEFRQLFRSNQRGSMSRLAEFSDIIQKR